MKLYSINKKYQFYRGIAFYLMHRMNEARRVVEVLKNTPFTFSGTLGGNALLYKSVTLLKLKDIDLAFSGRCDFFGDYSQFG